MVSEEDVWKCWQTDGRRTEAGVFGKLVAYLGAFYSGELITNKAWYFMRIVCWQTVLMKYHTLFLSKTRKDVAKFVVCCSRDWRFKGLCSKYLHAGTYIDSYSDRINHCLVVVYQLSQSPPYQHHLQWLLDKMAANYHCDNLFFNEQIRYLR